MSKQHVAGESASRRGLRPRTSFRPRLELLEERVVLNNDFFIVPGAANELTNVSFRWTKGDFQMDNEIGVYVVDDTSGRVDGVAPGSRQYTRTVLGDESRQVVFDSSMTPGANRTLSFAGGSVLAFYMIRGTTSATLLASNPRNIIGNGPNAFFSVSNANPDDRFDHVIRGRKGGAVSFRWEDGINAGDQDFNDVIFTARAVDRGQPGVPAGIHGGRAIKTPGLSDDTIPTLFSLRNRAAFAEIGLFRVDDHLGRIGNMGPSAPGYVNAALARRQVLFGAGDNGGANQLVNLAGNTFFGIYVIPRAGAAPIFSFLGANADKADHMRQLGDRVFGFETGSPLGANANFRDIIVSFDFRAPLPVDRVVPNLTARLQNDTGSSAVDGITMDPTIAGTVTDQSPLRALRAGFGATPVANFADITDTIDANGNFVLNLARLQQINGGALPDALYTLHLQAIDQRGNTSFFDVVFRLDTNGPTPLTWDLADASNTQDKTDLITTRNLVQLTGQTEGTTRVDLLANANNAAQNLVSNGAGTFTFNNINLVTGNNVFTIRATDLAGNVRDVMQTIELRTDPFVVQEIADRTLGAAVNSTTDVNFLLNFAALVRDNTEVLYDFNFFNDVAVELFDFDATGVTARAGEAGPRTTPLTVENYLNYVGTPTTLGNSRYQNNIIHRSVQTPNPFVLQGGRFNLVGAAGVDPDPLDNVPTNAAVTNEPGNSNVTGTIAMARQGGVVNSATSEWFFNQVPNTNLDTVDQGFTAFGRITNNLAVVTTDIPAVPTFTAIAANGANTGGGNLVGDNGEGILPLRNVASQTQVNQTFSTLTNDNFVTINNIFVTQRNDLLTFTAVTDNVGVTATITNNILTLTNVGGVSGVTVNVTITATPPGAGTPVSDTFAVSIP